MSTESLPNLWKCFAVSLPIDILRLVMYNSFSYIGQFVTILSVNKTRESMGAMRPFFVGWARCVHFFVIGDEDE